MKEILITTPSGKVGAEVAKQLLARRAPVRLAAHTVEKVRAAFPGTPVTRLDYTDAASVAEAVRGVDAVYLASPGDFPADREQRLIDAARAQGVRRIVKLSAIGVENTDAPIRQVERAVEASGIPWTFLRPNWFMQNFTTAHAESIRKGVLAEPAGEARTGFIDARDIAAVAVEALTGDGHAGRAYTLTGPQLLTRRQVVETVSAAIGREVKYLPVTDEQFRAAVKGLMPQSYVEFLSVLYASVRAGHTELVTDTVQQVLGRPAVSFAKFVAEHASVWR